MRLITTLLLFGGVLLPLYSAYSAEAPTAREVYEPVRKKYSTNSGLNSTVIAPMIGGTAMKTVDDTRTFTSGVLKSSGKPVFRISIVPNVATGDIAQISISQDLAGTGTYDTFSTFPVAAESGKMVSGVCGDGFISCPPGTFSDCSYNKWGASASGAIGVVHMDSVNGLSDCYCFNNGCSQFKNSAIMNQDQLVQTLGGGALTAFLAQHTDYVVSSATAGTGSLTYYGTKVTGVVTGQTAVGRSGVAPIIYPSDTPVDVMRMYPDTEVISGAGSSAVTAQKAQPASLYNLVMNVDQSSGAQKTCSDVRYVSTNTANRVEPFSYKASEAIDHQFALSLVRLNNSQFQLYVNSYGGTETWQDYVGPVYNLVSPVVNTGDMAITRFSSSATAAGDGCVSAAGSSTWTPSSGAGWPVLVLQTICPDKGVQTLDWTVNGSFEFKTEDLIENTTDNGCASLAANPACRLKDELWDGRPVEQEYLPTGFRMADICKVIPGELRATTICRPWWEKTKTYFCQNTTTPYNFDELRKRMSEVRTTAEVTDGGLMSYTDGGKANAYQLMVPPADQPCTQVCKTKQAVKETTVVMSGAVSDFQTQAAQTAAGFTFSYKECVDDGTGNMSCPAETGDTIVQGCTCSNQAEFGEAVAALSAFKEMTADTICSATPPGAQGAISDACKPKTTP